MMRPGTNQLFLIKWASCNTFLVQSGGADRFADAVVISKYCDHLLPKASLVTFEVKITSVVAE